MFWKTESEFTDAFCVTSYHFMKYVHVNKGSLNLHFCEIPKLKSLWSVCKCTFMQVSVLCIFLLNWNEIVTSVLDNYFFLQIVQSVNWTQLS